MKFSTKKTPKRICRDPHTVYCLGLTKYGHRGCCECTEFNAGDSDFSLCNPYLLPEETAQLKVWWEENDMGEWPDDNLSLNRPNMKKRGKK